MSFNNKSLYSNSTSTDSNEIWSDSPHYFVHSSSNHDSWGSPGIAVHRPNVLNNISPSGMSWNNASYNSPYSTGSYQQPSHQYYDQPSFEQQPITIPQAQTKRITRDVTQVISPTNHEEELIRSVDQLLLEDDVGIFEFDLGDASSYGMPYSNEENRQYKKRVSCKFYQNGSCKAGHKCRFAHEPLSPQPHTSIKYTQTSSSLSPQVHTPIRSNSYSSSPSFGVNPITGSKYCKFYINGFCRNGEACGYAHEQQPVDQLSSSMEKIQLYHQQNLYQQHLQQQITNNSFILQNHMLLQQDISPSSSPPLSDSSQSSQEAENLPKVCPFFLKGSCLYGDRCRNSHVKPAINGKKKLINEESLEKFSKIPCKYFRQGHCPFGDACYYLHMEPIKANHYGHDGMQNHY
ncbi:zinc finger CCCH domain-containing protein [Acrasis kona]|uniref:Zinc finger CCCH domain-containing protein n=1 Tax=Acrasis kona TaxID=1008807 RepID=A0AAW2ZNX2_9EUKA